MYNCRNCLFIRYFLIAVFFIVLFGIIFSDKTKYLSFISPKNFSYLILFFGTIIFIIKLFNHLKNLFISDKSNKIGNSSRKPSKRVTGKKIYWPIKIFWPPVLFSSPEWFIGCARKKLFVYFWKIAFFTYYTFQFFSCW